MMNAQTRTTPDALLMTTAGVAPAGTQTKPRVHKMVWAGRILSALPAIFMLYGGVNVAMKAPEVAEGFQHLQYPLSIAPGLGLVQFLCALLYVIPRTSVLGAILLTAYLGGATASHVRIGDPFFPPVVVGIVVWAGIFLRDGRIRTLIPLRKS